MRFLAQTKGRREREREREIGSEALAETQKKSQTQMVEHQPRLLGSRVRFPAGEFAIFCVSAKASLPIPFLLSLPLPSPSVCLRLFVCPKEGFCEI